MKLLCVAVQAADRDDDVPHGVGALDRAVEHGALDDDVIGEPGSKYAGASFSMSAMDMHVLPCRSGAPAAREYVQRDLERLRNVLESRP